MAKRKKKRAIQTENKVKNGLKVIKLNTYQIPINVLSYSLNVLCEDELKKNKLFKMNWTQIYAVQRKTWYLDNHYWELIVMLTQNIKLIFCLTPSKYQITFFIPSTLNNPFFRVGVAIKFLISKYSFFK